MAESEETLGARFDDETVKRIDAHLKRIAAPGTKPTRSDALRNLVALGLAVAEKGKAK